jgi:hypothetical protein
MFSASDISLSMCDVTDYKIEKNVAFELSLLL